ncbi:MAG: DUF4298 domain-containing protein [Erysipelotrichaceae bacterium]|nr:DUF4298 domain-containing protein [Erysipelotrichaceae bacterium]
MEKEYIERSVKRIKELESVFDEVSKTLKEEPIKLNDTEYQNKIKILVDYLDSGMWLKDYELDEKGLIDQSVKRGILSEDGLYNLIFEIQEFIQKQDNS